jgi:hypothetical protein
MALQMRMAVGPDDVDPLTLDGGSRAQWFAVQDRKEAHDKLDLLLDFQEQLEKKKSELSSGS